MNVDIVAYQDLGDRGGTTEDERQRREQAAHGFRQIKAVHEKTGVALWANCEVFGRETRPDGRPRCTPGPIERIVHQLQTETEPVDYVICYQYTDSL